MNALILTVSIWIIIPLGYVVFNLYNKNKKMESIILNQRIFVRDFLTMSKEFSRLVDKIDMTIWTSSDSELQELFEKIKSMKSVLDGYDENAQ